MSDLEFDTERIRDFSQELSIAVSGLDLELIRLETAVGTLRSEWSGDAQAAFDRAQLDWSGSMNELKSILQAIAEVCDFAAETYETTEDTLESAYAA